MARKVRIEFDPNVRVYGNGTYASLNAVVDVTVHRGERVVLFESEEGIEVDAEVTTIDRAANVVYFSVVWDSLRRFDVQTAEASSALVASTITIGQNVQRSFAPTAAFAFGGAKLVGVR
jgi:hypothetical protein